LQPCLRSSTTCASPRRAFSTTAIASVVVVERPGVEEHEVQWSVRDHQTLAIRAASTDRTFHRDIRLTEPVEARDA
jgi:HSP20 family molecular chaperone IbpA